MDSEAGRAGFALLGFLPVALWVVSKYKSSSAGIGLVFGALMFLPAHYYFQLPSIPPLGKTNLPYVFIALSAGLWMRARFRGAIGLRIDVPIGILLISSVATAVTNSEPLIYGEQIRAGMRLYDSASLSAWVLLECWVPHLVGRLLLRTRRDVEQLLKAFVAAGLLYSLFCLIEIRMSPQFAHWVYAHQNTAFWGAKRFGGFRPNVFMMHGMALGTFMATCLIAAAALIDSGRGRTRLLARAATPYLAIVLVLVKSTAAAVYGLASAPIASLRPRMMRPVVITLFAISVTYPVVRFAGFFPTATAVDLARRVSSERAQSLEFRFDNEDALLKHALDRPIFGWGGYGRSGVYDSYTGEKETVPDGLWIIVLGSRGIVGWLALLAFVTWPVLAALRAARREPDRRAARWLVSASLITMIYIVDWLPNGLPTTFPFFLAGGLWAAAHAPTNPKVEVRENPRPRATGPILGLGRRLRGYRR